MSISHWAVWKSYFKEKREPFFSAFSVSYNCFLDGFDPKSNSVDVTGKHKFKMKQKTVQYHEIGHTSTIAQLVRPSNAYAWFCFLLYALFFFWRKIILRKLIHKWFNRHTDARAQCWSSSWLLFFRFFLAPRIEYGIESKLGPHFGGSAHITNTLYNVVEKFAFHVSEVLSHYS